jgi:hypothetical protein
MSCQPSGARAKDLLAGGILAALVYEYVFLPQSKKK